MTELRMIGEEGEADEIKVSGDTAETVTPEKQDAMNRNPELVKSVNPHVAYLTPAGIIKLMGGAAPYKRLIDLLEEQRFIKGRNIGEVIKIEEIPVQWIRPSIERNFNGTKLYLNNNGFMIRGYADDNRDLLSVLEDIGVDTESYRMRKAA